MLDARLTLGDARDELVGELGVGAEDPEERGVGVRDGPAEVVDLGGALLDERRHLEHKAERAAEAGVEHQVDRPAGRARRAQDVDKELQVVRAHRRQVQHALLQ